MVVTPPTRQEIRELVESAKALGVEHLHFTVPRRRAPRGAWGGIRLLGRSGPLSAIDKACEQVGTDKDDKGRTVQLWSAWWRVRDIDLWLQTGRGV